MVTKGMGGALKNLVKIFFNRLLAVSSFCHFPDKEKGEADQLENGKNG
jgi:hypothetical protein